MSLDQEPGPDLLPGQMTGGPLTIRMRMPSDPRLLPVVRNAISEFAAVCGFDKVQCRRIALAVDEALSNVIRHAYKNRCDCEVELDCQLQKDCLEVAFVDHGEPTDPSRLCPQPLDELALGGRGTHLIHQIMDEVCYERLGERNLLRLKKYLPAANSKASRPADQVRGKA
ncbi:MAG: ATP-binding protein [Acidobacteriota bacterium]|nr:ATP-binding protein [Acidobacteriota bacterium]